MTAPGGAAFRIGDGYIDVTLRGPDQAEIERIRARLRGLDTDIRVGIDDRTEADIARIRARLAGLDTTATVRVNSRGAEGDVGRLGRSMRNLLAIGAGGLLLTNSVASLGAAAVATSGALLLIPAAAGAAGATAATLKVGVTGVADAFKLAEKGGAEYAKALANLAPAARQFVQATVALGPAWKALRLDVQAKLFDGLGASIKTLGDLYIPKLRTGMGQVATSLNLVTKDFAGFLRMPKTVQDTAAGFELTARALNLARPGITGFSVAMRDIMAVGATFLPRLGAAFADVGERFANFISQARTSGQLEEWINNGLTSLRQLGSIAGNVGSVLGSMFKAAKASGADFLGTLDRLTTGVATFMRSGQGQTALVSLFREARAVVDGLTPGLMAAGRAAASFITSLTNTGGLSAVATSISGIVSSLAPLGGILGNLAGQTLGNLASAASLAGSALTPLVSIFGGITSGLGGVVPAVLAMVVAFKGVAMITPMLVAQGAALTAASAKWGLYTTAMTGSMAAGGAAATAITRVGVALSFVGRAVPWLAAATVAIALLAGSQKDAAGAAQEHQSAIDGLAGTLDKVTGAATDATTAMQAQDIASRKLGDGTTHFASAIAAAGIDLKDYTQAASGNEQALAKVNAQLVAAVQRAPEFQRMTQVWGAAFKQAGVGMQELSAAAAGNGPAMDSVIQKMGLTGATADQMRDRIRESAGSVGELGSALGVYSGTVAEAQQQTRDAAAAVKDFGSTLDAIKVGLGGLASGAPQTAVLSAGFRDLAVSAQDAAHKAGAAGAAVGGVAAGGAAAAASMQKSRDAFVEAATAAGMTAEQANALANQIGLIPAAARTTFETNASGVGAELSTLKAQFDAVPNSKQITVQSLTEEAKAKLTDLGFTVTTLPDGTIMVTANTDSAKANLASTVAAVNSATGTFTLDANPARARSQLQSAVTGVNTAKGTMTIDGNPTLARGKTTAAVTFANGSKGTITIDGNQTPANGKVTAVVRFANGSTGTIQVNANTSAAESAINRLARTTYSQHIVRISSTGSVKGQPQIAGGGIIGYSGGGTVGSPMRASRGMVVPGYEPGVDRVNAVLSRGESVLVPELTRMIGARNIMAANAAASGGRAPTVVGRIPGAMMNGTGYMSQGAGPGGGDMAAEIRALGNTLARAGGRGAVTVNVIQASKSDAETGRLVALALRGTG